MDKPNSLAKPRNFTVELIGWYGAVAIVAAYALNSFAIIGANSLVYQLLNATGAIGIVIVSLKKGAYQPAVLNVVWTIIAVIAISKIFI